MYCREDLRKLKQINLLWDYIREITELNRPLLLGEARGVAVRRLERRKPYTTKEKHTICGERACPLATRD